MLKWVTPKRTLCPYAGSWRMTNLSWSFGNRSHSQRHTLTLDELLAAMGTSDYRTPNEIEQMVSRNTLIRSDKYSGYAARRRFLAEQVVSSQEFKPQIKTTLEGVYFALATPL